MMSSDLKIIQHLCLPLTLSQVDVTVIYCFIIVTSLFVKKIQHKHNVSKLKNNKSDRKDISKRLKPNWYYNESSKRLLGVNVIQMFQTERPIFRGVFLVKILEGIIGVVPSLCWRVITSGGEPAVCDIVDVRSWNMIPSGSSFAIMWPRAYDSKLLWRGLK